MHIKASSALGAQKLSDLWLSRKNCPVEHTLKCWTLEAITEDLILVGIDTGNVTDIQNSYPSKNQACKYLYAKIFWETILVRGRVAARHFFWQRKEWEEPSAGWVFSRMLSIFQWVTVTARDAGTWPRQILRLSTRVLIHCSFHYVPHCVLRSPRHLVRYFNFRPLKSH